MEEPSVWDYVKSRLAFWRKGFIVIPAEVPKGTVVDDNIEDRLSVPDINTGLLPTDIVSSKIINREKFGYIKLPIFLLVSLLFALIGQRAFEPSSRSLIFGIAFYIFAFICLSLAAWRDEIYFVDSQQNENQKETYVYRPILLILGLVTGLLAFLAFGGGVFNQFNVFIWLVSILSTVAAFWQGGISTNLVIKGNDKWSVQITKWKIILLIAMGIILFYRIFQLDLVPAEMVSDHAEKLLDISDVLNGEFSVFFPRNTGREGLQMYLTAAISLLFGTGLSFISLKIGSVLAGLITLPYIYMLGKEIGNRSVGLLALLFCGIAYWPNVISRIALRFTLYPLFVAPTMYYLLRGFRTSGRNYFILAGIFLGLGLHGYSAFRIVPILVLVGFLFLLIHKPEKVSRRQVFFWLFLVVLISFLVFLPLLRYSINNPTMFSYRTLTRLGTTEKPLDAPAILIFLNNLWKALAMFGWDNGEVWVVSIPHRPALSVVSAALFYLGTGILFIRYIRKRNWVDFFLILSVPILMLPSILSLAFPAENPILNRTAGAIIPVFVVIGIALVAILESLRFMIQPPWGKIFGWGLGILLCIWSAVQDYDLVFNQYKQNYLLSSWNTSEMGHIIGSYSESIGNPDNAWVVAFPYWVDTRLVGINAGYPQKDYAISQEKINQTLSINKAKLFLVKPDDEKSINILKRLYPYGEMKEFVSRVETKNFLIFFIPSKEHE